MILTLFEYVQYYHEDPGDIFWELCKHNAAFCATLFRLHAHAAQILNSPLPFPVTTFHKNILMVLKTDTGDLKAILGSVSLSIRKA